MTAERPALARYLAWLDETADRLEREATEREVVANGQALYGSLAHRYYLQTLERVERKRTRAVEYRRKALKLRIEENKRRRTSA